MIIESDWNELLVLHQSLFKKEQKQTRVFALQMFLKNYYLIFIFVKIEPVLTHFSAQLLEYNNQQIPR